MKLGSHNMKTKLMHWLRKGALVLGAVAGLTAQTQGPAQAQTITYYHNDVSGTPILATDAAGNVLWKESYRPYGDKLKKQAASSTNRIGFHGKPFDDNTGLSYMGARYYDPLLGRFTGIDPQGVEPGNLHSFNRYAYGNNNPYKYVDPDGRSAIDVVFFVYDLGKLSVAMYTGVGVGAAAADVAMSAVGVVSPVPFVGQAMKVARGVERAAEVARGADKVADVVRGGEKAGEVAKGGEKAAGAVRGAAGGERAGKDFTKKGKAEIDAANAEKHGGSNACDNCSQSVVPGQRSERGVAPPGNERQRDHIIAKSKGGDGDPSNGQILCRTCNLNKSDK